MKITCSESKLTHSDVVLYCFMQSVQLPTANQLLQIIKADVNLRMARPINVWTVDGIAEVPIGMIRIKERMPTMSSRGYVISIQGL